MKSSGFFNPFADTVKVLKTNTSDYNDFSQTCTKELIEEEKTQVPIFHKDSLKNIKEQLKYIAQEKGAFASYKLAVLFMYDAICGHHLLPYDEDETYEGYNDDSYVVGYISFILLGIPLLSRKLRHDLDDTCAQDEINKTNSKGRKIALMMVIAPLELARILVSFVLTAAYALTAAPLVTLAAKCAEAEQQTATSKYRV